MKVAILGAGAGGASAAVELTRDGHEVRLWNRSAATLAAFAAAHGILHEGVIGTGFTPLEVITTQLERATEGVEVLLVCLPTLAHAALAQSLVDASIVHIPTILNPGHTGGALEFSQVFRQNGLAPPPVAEFSTLTYVARIQAPGFVVTTGRAKAVRAAAMPGARRALDLALALYDCARPADNVLVTSLANVNMVLHPPGAVLGAAWVEATGGNFTFYVEGLTGGVARVMQSLDTERRAVARTFGIELPSLFEEMQAIGTIESTVAAEVDFAAGIRAGAANRLIKAPAGFAHRYYREDLWYGLSPFLVLARIAGVEALCARALNYLGTLAARDHAPVAQRTAIEMGIAGLDRDALLAFVSARGEP
jgi:opine dehydrogenase